MIPLREFIMGTRDRPTIVAHRGDWSSAPENSLQAIRNAVCRGVEIVEIDVRRSRDGKFFLLHDSGLERMTAESGRAADRALRDLTSLRLLAGNGQPGGATCEPIPTLAEALSVARGRIYFDLDVKHREDLDDVARVVAEMGMNEFCNLTVKVQDQGSASRLRRLQEDHQIMVKPMTVFDSDNIDGLIDVLEPVRPGMVESKFDSLSTISRHQDRFASSGIAIWANTLDSVACCGLTDAVASREPGRVWGALVRAGVSIVQTDLPNDLMRFRRKHVAAGLSN